MGEVGIEQGAVGQQTRVYVDLRWWPLTVSLAVIVAGLVIAGALSRRRDVGAGLRPASAGPEQASSVLLAPGGLAGRLVTPMMLARSEEHTSELQSRGHLVCRLLLEQKKK